MKRTDPPVTEKKLTQLFSYEITMLVHVVGTDETSAKKDLDEKGGIVTKREVTLLNTVTLYGEKDKE